MQESYNRDHNILQLFHISPIFCFTASEKEQEWYKNGIHDLSH